MGRYYNGDVEGKWWFGVQSSDTPQKFGGYETHIDYTISYDDTFKNRMEGMMIVTGKPPFTFYISIVVSAH